MAEELFVAREGDLAVLNQHWEAVKAGQSRVLRLQAPFGGGRRALVGQFLNQVSGGTDDAIVWRAICLDHENGIQWLVRMYGALIASLTNDPLRRGKMEMVLNAQLPSQPKRVQGWFQAFISAMKEAKPDREKGSIQLKLPQDNPLIGLVEVVAALSRKVPVVLELQNPHVVYSLALAQLVEGLMTEAREKGGKIFIVMHDEASNEENQSLWPMPLVDLYQRRGGDMVEHAIAPWGESETARYLTSKGASTQNAARIAEIAGGRPGFIAELVEILEERGELEGDLSATTFGSLVPLTVDEDELDLPEAPAKEGERQHAGPGDVDRVVFLAALLGQAFPSGLVADMGGFDRDSIDDLVDAMEDTFEEVQFSQELGTWIYKFKRGSWREGVLERNANEESNELALRVGQFMERFLMPRGYGFIVKTARVYAEHKAYGRANVLRSIALTNDAPDVWGLAYDFTRYFDEVAWPDPMVRTIYLNLVDRMVGGGALQTAEQVHQAATAWAADKNDAELSAWLLFAGSRLDLRRGDLYRARDRGRDAKAKYEAMNNAQRVAEIECHLAAVELQDGNTNAATSHIERALQVGQFELPDGKRAVQPNIAAQAEQIRGVVARQGGKLEEAANHFRQANEIAGQAGMGPLALEAGLSFGEALLAGRQVEQAREVLQRVVQIAQQLQNPIAERSACELAAQAEGALRNYEAAIQLAGRTLQLSQALKFEQVLPIDLYNLGFFNYALNKPTEALTFFRQASQRIGAVGNHPVVKELYYFHGLAALRTGELDEAKRSLNAGLKPARDAKDWSKVVSAMGEIAGIEHKQGNVDSAKRVFNEAMDLANAQNLKEQRKSLRKRFDGVL